MFAKKTVFIVGAGAGVDIEMPVGDRLSESIAGLVKVQFSDFGRTKLSGDDLIFDAIRQIARDQNIDVNDLRRAGVSIADGIRYSRSVDNYVHAHKDKPYVALVAKLAIGRSILQAEKKSSLFINDRADRLDFADPKKVHASWMQGLMHILQDGVIASETLDDFFTNIAIVNFNYDRCIEFFFESALNSLYGRPEKTKELLKKLKIFHPYGTIGKLHWQDIRGVLPFGALTDHSGLIYRSQFLKTYNEEVEDSDSLRDMWRHIYEANVVVFLGFHFHKQNMDLLTSRLPQETWSNPVDRIIYATAYERSDADLDLIDRRIGQVWTVGGRSTNLLKGVDCKVFFRDFSSALMN